MRQKVVSIHHPAALPVLFAAAILVAGLLALVGARPAGAAEPNFAQLQHYPVGSTPTTVTSADFNGDGKVDLAAQNARDDNVSVLPGNGDGTFRAKQDHALGEGSGPSSVIGADLNDDGNADLTISNQLSGNVSVLLGKGDGTFKDRLDFAVGGLPSSVISADLNSDSYADLALASFGSNTVAVLLGQDLNGDGKNDVGQDFDGNGSIDGGFKGAQHFKIDPRTPCNGGTGDPCLDRTMASPNQVIAEDFNSDGKMDLATANIGGCFTGDGGVSVLSGNGDGSFQDARVYSMGLPACDQFFNQINVATSITTTDVNTDGKEDLAVAVEKSNVVSVLRGNGDGTFQAKQDFTAGARPSAVTSTDFDGDRRADLAVSNFGSDNVSVFFNNGSGGLQASRSFPAGDGPIFVIGPDVNADNLADLAVANQNSNNISVLLNTVEPPDTTRPTVSAVSPPDAATGVAPNASVTATFSEAMNRASVEAPGTFTLEQGMSPASATVTYDSASKKATLRPGSDLAWNATYTATITGGSGGAEDTAGNTLERDYSWSFSTVTDRTAPSTTPTLSPQPNAAGWNNSNVTVTLTATDTGGSGVKEIVYSASGAKAIPSTTVPGGSATFNINVEGTTTISYLATDNAGNRETPPKTFEVKLDKSAPTLDGITPHNREMGVSRSVEPTATFSEEMDPTSLGASVKLYQWNARKHRWKAVPATVNVVHETATLDPYPADSSRQLAAKKKFKVTVTTGAKDLAGLSLSSARSWTFTTGST